jgi:glycosyltransferase involved in cell wall biosynthesis
VKNGADWMGAVREDLTIVIPAYRCAPYLSGAVASTLHSPVRRILIADDAGDDETLRIAEGLASAYPDRVRVLTSPINRGTASNLNEAVERVETRFFAKPDGDDVFVPGYLERVFPLIASRPRVGVLAGHELRIEADEALAFRQLLPAVRHSAPLNVMAGAAAYRFIVTWNPNPTSSGVICRTEAFREIGGCDRTTRSGEDWEIWKSATATAIRENRLCYGYDSVFRRAADLREYVEVLPLIGRRMFCVAKLYAAAASRLLWRSRRESLECCRQAVRAMSLAIRMHAEAARSWLSRSRRFAGAEADGGSRMAAAGDLAPPSPTAPEIENVR